MEKIQLNELIKFRIKQNSKKKKSKKNFNLVY